MNIAATQYNLENQALEIYFSGCHFHCKNCHNPELWNPRNGNLVTQETINDIIGKINAFPELIKSIWLLGGEPLDQNLNDLIYFIQEIQKKTNVLWWLWTGYEYCDIKLSQKELDLFDYIKCGLYEEEIKTDTNIQYGIKLASSNQYVIRKKEFYFKEE